MAGAGGLGGLWRGAVVAVVLWLAASVVPAAPAAARHGRTVLLVGDSLLAQTQPFLEPLLVDAGWRPVFRAVPGTGLLSSEIDWIAEIRSLVAEHRPDVAVAEFVGNHFEASPPPGSTEFLAAWARRANEAFDALASEGAAVHWALNPPMRDATLDRRADDVDLVSLGLTHGHPSIEFLDWAAALADADGSYTDAIDGEAVRGHDGVHLTEAGARRTAAVTAAWLRQHHARLAGADRVGTAVAVSARTFASAGVAVLARADDPADALAGGPLAARLDAPLLLTERERLSPPVAAELDRLGVTSVVLLGGPGALGPGVASDLAGRDVERLAGADRAATAAAIAARVGGDGVLVADGLRGWPDALAAAPLGARTRRPILLSLGGVLPPATRDALRGRNAATIVGGTAAVPTTVELELRALVVDVDRIAGADRYETAAAVADAAVAAGAALTTTWVASGRDWPDALPAGAAAGESGAVLVLVDGMTIRYSPASAALLTRFGAGIDEARVVGGVRAVTPRAASEVALSSTS